ncbi:hypothetical protein [Endozoicomonas sp. ONNA1]|uniref:hypothetical protein n=1 Tax=Endozoicomonas sp. ONNA1 TaxID=2828740 RepID=UPI00214973EA|nr:hypothetical protein [Endozoicomonas sp. ONNA1]
MPQSNISQAGISPALPKISGTDSAPVIRQEAGNPGRLNCDSIIAVDLRVSLNDGSLEPSRLSGRSLPEFNIQAVLPGDVEKKLPIQASREDRLAAKTNNVQKKISQERSKTRPKVDRSSEDALKVALKDANTSLKEARNLQSEAHSLAKQGVLEENLLELGLGGKRMTKAENDAFCAARDSDDLVSSRKQDVKDLERAQKDLKAEQKRAAKADKKAHQALDRLQKDLLSLGRSVPKIRSKVVAAKDHSSKRLGEELKSLQRAQKKAKALAAHGKKLLAKADEKQMKHGIDTAPVKDAIKHHISDAETEVKQLEIEVASLKQTVKLARQSEKAYKKQQKEDDRILRQQEKAAKKAARKKTGLSEKTQSPKELLKKNEASKVEKPIKEPIIEGQKQEVSRTPSDRASFSPSELPPLKSGKTQMRAFLKGITPQKAMTAQALEKAMETLHKPNDYRQVLADIVASGLNVEEQVRLRSGLSACMLGAMRDPEKFKLFNRGFIEHIMFGDSMVEIQQQYPVSVKKDLERIDKEAARK